MSKTEYYVWTNEAGLHWLDGAMDVNEEELLRFSSLQTRRKLDALINDDSGIESIYAKYYRETNGDIKLQTPISLFVNAPQLFFEIFWPYARRALGRQYYILKFVTPLQIILMHDYELKRDNSGQEIDMLYLGCVTQRVPIMRVNVENAKESIIPYEMLVNKIQTFLANTEEWAYVGNRVDDSTEQLHSIVRQQLTRLKPVFVEYNPGKYSNEEIITVSLECDGSILKAQSKSDSNGNIFARVLRTFVRALRTIAGLLHVSLEEPNLNIHFSPKSPIIQCWIYIYAPERYHLKENSVSQDNENNILESMSINPELLSYRFGRKDKTDKLGKLSLGMSICIPNTQKLWINLIDKVLLTFMIIWLIADISILDDVFSLWDNSVGLDIFERVVAYPGFFETTFVLISFIFVARTWFLHESNIYKPASYRFAVVLLILAALSLLYVFIANVII